MVCPRCITAVNKIFLDLGAEIQSSSLGQVVTNKLPENKTSILRENLLQLGFELLDDKESKLINQIKSIVIQQIHQENISTTVNLSTILSQELRNDYSYLSRLFSSIEGRTIEKFVLQQKIERVKELLTYDQLSISEIAHKMSYSSNAHLSTQFKKVTGMTPTSFKKMRTHNRSSLDEI